MLTVYRKELKLRFVSLSTYILLSLFFLAFGILSSVFNLSLGYASISYPLGYMTLIQSILLPFLVYFSKKGRGNDHALIFSFPISPASVVLGEFLASVTLLLIPVSVISLLPLLFSLFGSSPILSSEIALLGFFLYSVFLLCVIQFLFCAIKKPLISLCASLLFTLAIYFFNSLFFLLPFPVSGAFQKLSALLNPTGMYYSFTYGKFNLPGTVYFIALSSLFLLLHILLLLKRRGDLFIPKKRIVTALASVLLILLILASTVVTALLPEKIAYTDVSGADISHLSGKTLDTLHALDEPLTLYVLSKGGIANTDRELLSFFRRYEEESDFLRIEVIDTEKNPDFSKAYTAQALNDQSVIVVGEKRHFAIDNGDLYYYQNDDLGVIPSDDYNYLINSYLTYLQTSSMDHLDESAVQLGYHLYYSTSTVAYFNGDNLILNAILFVTSSDVRDVYVVKNDRFSVSKEDTTLEQVLSKNDFFISHTDQITRIPENCDLLVLFTPKKDISAQEKEELESYLSRGGKIFLTTDYTSNNLPLLSSLLSAYGLIGDYRGIVCETDKNYIAAEDTSFYFAATVHNSLYATDYESGYVSILSHPLQLEKREGVKATAILTTTEKGALKDPVEDEFIEEGAYVVGAISEKGDSSILWLSSSLSVSSTANTLSSGANLRYVLSLLQELCPETIPSATVTPILLTPSTIILSDGNFALWTLIIAVLLPLISISAGIVYTYTRKKRF